MLKTLKFSGEETNFFFISDLHYGHAKSFIYTKRKGLDGNFYKSVEEHDNGVVQSWNSVCPNNSTVFNLGDVTFNDKDGSRFLNLMRRLNFKEHYILWGNHVSGHRQIYLQTLKKNFPEFFIGELLLAEVYPLILKVDNDPNKVVIFLPQYAEIQINSTRCALCHYPVISHNDMSHGSLHLCGHSHGGCELTNANTGNGFRLDVGVESFGRPITLKEVKYHLRNRTIDAPDHHTKENTKS